MAINMGSARDYAQTFVRDEKDVLTVDWIGDRVLLNGEPFLTRDDVDSDEFPLIVRQRVLAQLAAPGEVIEHEE